jgi:hypothetical protein
MHRVLAHGWRFCAAATVLLALGGCSAQIRHGILDGYDHASYGAPCGAAFIGYHGPIERCMDD